LAELEFPRHLGVAISDKLVSKYTRPIGRH
jgi:hypothetical protein